MRTGTLVSFLAILASSCTMTFHRDERDRAPFVPASERPTVQLEVVECRALYGHENSVRGFAPEERVSARDLERLRELWESSGAFERVDGSTQRAAGPAELVVRLRLVRDELSRSPSAGAAVLYLWPVVLPWLCVAGFHSEVRIVWEARFERAGEVLGEITRAERLTRHGHWLFLLPARVFTEQDAQHEAEEDLLHSILVEARRRAIL